MILEKTTKNENIFKTLKKSMTETNAILKISFN